jgi:hypothetical protein
MDPIIKIHNSIFQSEDQDRGKVLQMISMLGINLTAD